VTEFPNNFPREWFEFKDPENPLQVFRCDLTWLTSNWHCIFGQGCKGIDKEFPEVGCCSDGAYYFDKADETRVTQAAERLTSEIWENYSKGYRGKKIAISEKGLDDDRKTKKINEVCIFFNSSKFNDEYFGCALHHLAVREDVHFAETKPDICWQLPMRRSWETREIGDVKESVVVIGEYVRDAWGEGGADLDWYCTSNTEAHTSSVPVYISNKTELTKMMTPKSYEILAKRCDEIMAARKNRKTRDLPLYIIHPASR
jgi:hypothetical protein